MDYTVEEVREWAAFAQAQGKLYAPMKGAHEPWEKLEAMLTAYAERIEADEVAADYPECSGDPSSCPENEGHGCCKPNPPAQAAQGEASLGRCKACGRATRAVCDGIDGNGLGCTNAPSIDLSAVRKVIAHLRQFDSPYTRGLADKLEAALQEKGNG